MSNKLIAFVTNKQTTEAVNSLQNATVIKGNILTAQEKFATEQSPAYLVVELSSKKPEEAFAELDKLASVCHKDTEVIVTGDVDELSFYKKLISMGVKEYLLNPVQPQALERLLAPKQPEPNKPTTANAKDCKVIAVIGTRGGVGASSLALNLAAVLASSNQPTALIDFDPEFGTIPLMLDIEPSRGFVDALEKPDRVDSLFLERAMTKIGNNLCVLGAERAIGEVGKIDEKAAEVLLTHLKAKFSYVVVDVSEIKPHEYFILKSAECLVVTELSIPGLRDSMRVFDLISENLGNKKITTIANKVGLNKKFETPLKDFEQGLGRKIDFQIPFEADAYGYFESGKIMATTYKDTKFAKAIATIAAKFLLNSAEASSAEKPVKKNLLDSLLGKK